MSKFSSPPESADTNPSVRPSEVTAELRFDGACSGNPGPSGYGVVLDLDGEQVTDEGYIGKATNNQAEYEALIASLERALEEGVDHLLVHSDSQLVIRQMTGAYNVGSDNLKSLHDQATRLREEFESVEFNWVERSENERADELARKARDFGVE